MPRPVGTFRQKRVKEVPGAKQAGRMCAAAHTKKHVGITGRGDKICLIYYERGKGSKKYEKGAKETGK